MSSYGVTRPQWVKPKEREQNECGATPNAIMVWTNAPFKYEHESYIKHLSLSLNLDGGKPFKQPHYKELLNWLSRLHV